MKTRISSALLLPALMAASLTFAGGCKDKTMEHSSHHQNAPVSEQSENAAMVITKGALRPPLPSRTTAMATFTVENKTDKDDVLLSASSPVSPNVEIHTIITEGDIKKMRRIEDGITVPAKGQAALKHGGDHVMLFDAVIPEGASHVPLFLKFKNQGRVEIQLIVDDGSMDHHSGH
jgi:copper(I)-binding protein